MAVVRLDTGGALVGAPATDALAAACLTAVQMHHGPVGWLSTEKAVVNDSHNLGPSQTVEESDNTQEANLSSTPIDERSCLSKKVNYMGLSDHDAATLKEKSEKVLITMLCCQLL